MRYSIIYFLILTYACANTLSLGTTQDYVLAFNKTLCNGCLNCSYNMNKLQVPETNYFSFKNITNNNFNITTMNITNETTQGKYLFKTKNITRHMQYIAYQPLEVGCRKGVVLYLHGTLFGKGNPPSNGGTEVKSLASVFGFQGYCIVFPDFLGYNQSYPNEPRPYLESYQQNIQSSILAANDFYKKRLNQSKNVSLHVIGFSQGANYAIFFEMCKNSSSTQCPNQTVALQKNYNIRSVVSISGPLALHSVMYQFLKDDVGTNHDGNKYRINRNSLANAAKPLISLMSLQSFLFYYYIGNADVSPYVPNQFFNMKCGPQLSQTLCNNLKNETQNLNSCLKSRQASIYIAMQIAFSSYGKGFVNRLPYLSDKLFPIDDGYQNGYQNSIRRLFNQIIENDRFVGLLAAGSPIRYQPSVSHLLFYLNQDSVVSPLNSQAYIKQYFGSGRLKYVKYQNNDQYACRGFNYSIDHIGSQLIGAVYALKFINQRV